MKHLASLLSQALTSSLYLTDQFSVLAHRCSARVWPLVQLFGVSGCPQIGPRCLQSQHGASRAADRGHSVSVLPPSPCTTPCHNNDFIQPGRRPSGPGLISGSGYGRKSMFRRERGGVYWDAPRGKLILSMNIRSESMATVVWANGNVRHTAAFRLAKQCVERAAFQLPGSRAA